MTGPTARSRAIAVLLATGLAASGGAATAANAAGDPDQHQAGKSLLKEVPKRDKLGSHDRELLTKAENQGKKRVTLLLATTKGQTASVARSIKAAGGAVGFRNDRVGYVRASVLTKNVARTAALGAVLTVDLDEKVTIPDPRVTGGRATAAAAAAATAPGRTTPDANPFMPTSETGAVAFKKAHPTWDGRGTTIGILDSGVDLDHPALSRTTTGARKIVDWITVTDPLEDPSWRAMRTAVTGPDVVIGTDPVHYRTPAGEFRVNVFRESITEGSEPGGDVNRDGDTTDVFGVLYDPASHDVRVDSDQDHDFTNNPAMRPYKEKFQVGHFGKDKPATTDVVESMPFVVEYREDVDLTPAGLPGQTADFVSIGIPEDAHATHVAGITAANKMFGGTMNGAAPGAKIVSARGCNWGGGCTFAALTDGMVDLVANRRVDVVNMSIGGLPALNDGNNTRAVLYNRLIDEFGVQIFLSAGNSGPGVNTMGDPAVATDAVAVASSISKATWKSNYGSVVSSALALHNFSSRGPREDGGFKPNIMAPGSAVSTVPRWLKQPDVADAGYALPPGYAMFNGTSMASPQAAGGAALLLSAAKASNLATTPPMLRESIYSSARFVSGIPAVGQGNGQLNVVRAWEYLRKRPVLPAFTISAPVCTEISQFLATPDRGTGIYNRCTAADGGQVSGVAKSYRVTITRTTGKAGSVTYSLGWQGNDGTFTAPRSVALVRGVAKTITVTAKASASGVHSAALRLNDRNTLGIDGRMMAAVVVPRRLGAPGYGTTWASTVQRNLTKSLFVTVPRGATALQVNLSGIAPSSQTRFIAFDPYGLPVEDTSSLQCYTNFSDASLCKPTSRSYADPIPGVWEIEVESRRTTPFLSNPFKVAAVVQGVTVTPAEVVLPSVTAGEPTPVSWTVRNTFGPVAFSAKGGPLGSSSASRKTIADQESQTTEVVVPAGATRLDAVIGNTSDLGADLDLSVFLDGTLVGQSADGDSEEAVRITNPEPGTYTVVIDGFDVPAGTTQYDYRDVFYSFALGDVAVPGTTVTLDNGESTTVSGAVTARTAPAAGRQLRGEVSLLSSEGALLGTGAVVVQSVTAP